MICVFLLPLLFTNNVLAAAISSISTTTTTTTIQPTIDDNLIHTIVRKPGTPDILHPANCSIPCARQFRASNYSLSEASSSSCACICPDIRPIFQSSIGECVDQLNGECDEPILWESNYQNDRLAPTVRLLPHTIILPDTPILFEERDIAVSTEGEVNCTIIRVLYENIHHKWKILPRRTWLFELTYMNQKPILYFRGTEFDASFLAGSIIQIKLKCETNSNVEEQYCLALRSSGISGRLQHFDRSSSDFEEPGWRIETILLLVFVSFVAITLISTFVIWNICWKIKKRKLISDFQMQFIQQFRHHQNKYDPQEPLREIEFGSDPLSPMGMLPTRRKLYFSSEYFDRDHLENPPPMAEQFLYDLRRMVDSTKERIRQRRFQPVLVTIPEDGEEQDDEMREEDEMSSQKSSPRSEPKSVDSGRESKEDSEDEDANNISQLADGAHQESKVADIVKNFEKSTKPSQLPILRSSSSSSIKRKTSNEEPKVSKLQQPRQIVNKVIPNKTEIESRIKAPNSYVGRSLKDRKGFIVYPSDGTFNKSLPRRPKRVPS